jgi:hypothetical protein
MTEPFQTMSRQHLNLACGLPTDWSGVGIEPTFESVAEFMVA